MFGRTPGFILRCHQHTLFHVSSCGGCILSFMFSVAARQKVLYLETKKKWKKKLHHHKWVKFEAFMRLWVGWSRACAAPAPLLPGSERMFVPSEGTLVVFHHVRPQCVGAVFDRPSHKSIMGGFSWSSKGVQRLETTCFLFFWVVGFGCFYSPLCLFFF